MYLEALRGGDKGGYGYSSDSSGYDARKKVAKLLEKKIKKERNNLMSTLQRSLDENDVILPFEEEQFLAKLNSTLGDETCRGFVTCIKNVQR